MCEDCCEEFQQITSRLDHLGNDLTKAENRIQSLEARLDTIVGVPSPDESSPEGRRRDVREGLIRRAEARSAADKASMHYQEVLDFWADHGHGSFSKPVAYDAIEDVSESPGFSEATKKKEGSDGVLRDAKAIRVNLAALPDDAVSNQVTTAEGPAGGSTATTTAANESD